MDTQKLIALLRATMDPNERKAAEDQLTQVSEAENLRNSQRHVLIRDAMPIQQRTTSTPPCYLAIEEPIEWINR